MFPTLFDLIDAMTEPDAGRLTTSEQDTVTDACWQCRRWVIECPFAPGRDQLAIDVPEAVVRSTAMRRL